MRRALLLLVVACDPQSEPAKVTPKAKPAAKGIPDDDIQKLEAAYQKAEQEHPDGLPDCGPNVKGPCSMKSSSEIGWLVDGAWQRGDKLPPAVHGHGEALRGAYVAPDGTGFLAGYNYTGVPGPDTGVVYRKDPGGAWTIVFQKPEHEVGHLFGTSANDVWVTGVETVAHWDGTAWKDDPPAGVRYFAGGWTDGKDVYVVGDKAVYHRDTRGTWQRETVAKGTLNGVAALGDQVFAVGNKGAILYRDHAKWTAWSTGDEQHLAAYIAGPDDVYLAGTRLMHGGGKGTWDEVTLPRDVQVVAVWGRGPRDVYAGTLAGLFHWDGIAWTESGWKRDVEAVAGNSNVVLVANQHTGG